MAKDAFELLEETGVYLTEDTFKPSIELLGIRLTNDGVPGFSLLVMVWLFFGHGAVAVLDRNVLDDGLVVLFVVPFATEVLWVMVRDEIRVAVLILHWNKLWLKRLDMVDYGLFTCSF